MQSSVQAKTVLTRAVLQFPDGSWLQGSFTQGTQLQSTTDINKAKKYKSPQHLEKALASYIKSMRQALHWKRQRIAENRELSWDREQMQEMERTLEKVSQSSMMWHTQDVSPCINDRFPELLDQVTEIINEEYVYQLSND